MVSGSQWSFGHPRGTVQSGMLSRALVQDAGGIEGWRVIAEIDVSHDYGHDISKHPLTQASLGLG